MSDALHTAVRILRTNLSPDLIAERTDAEEYLAKESARIIRCVDHYRDILQNLFSDARHIAHEQLDKLRHFPTLPLLMARIQRDATRGLDVLYVFFHTKYADDLFMLSDRAQEYYERMFEKFRDLLFYLWTSRRAHFNMNGPVPHYYRALKAEKTRRKIANIKRIFSEGGFPEGFAEVSAITLLHLLKRDHRFTFAECATYRSDVMSIRIAVSDMRTSEFGLTAAFFWLPVFPVVMPKFYVDLVRSILAPMRTPNEKLVFFHGQVKMIKFLMLDYRHFFLDQKQEAVDKILEIIALEIEHLEKIAPLSPAMAPSHFSQEPSSGNSPRQKLKVDLTVHEITELIKAMIRSGLLKNDFNEAAKIIGPYLQTPRVEEVTFDSLRAKNYLFDKGVLENVRRKLEMVMEGLREG